MAKTKFDEFVEGSKFTHGGIYQEDKAELRKCWNAAQDADKMKTCPHCDGHEILEIRVQLDQKIYIKCVCIDDRNINDIAKEAFHEGYKRCTEDEAADPDEMVMTKEDALKIREWREQGTWRWVATKAAKYWPMEGYMSGNQIEGMDLCHKAAKTLGESPQNKPWN